MRKEEILEKIEKRKKELSFSYQKDPGCDYLKQFIKNNKVKTVEDFLEMDIWSCVKCLYYICSNKSFSIEEVDSMFDSFSSLFDSLSAVSIGPFLDFLNDFSSYEKTNEIIDYLENKKGIKDTILLKKVCDENALHSEILTKLKRIHEGREEGFRTVNLVSLFQLLGENPGAFLDSLEFFHVHLEMKQNSEIIRDQFEKLDIRRREQKNFFDSWFQENYSIQQIIRVVNRIPSFVKRVEKEVKKKEAMRDGELRELDIAIKLLERGFSQEEITNAKDIVKYVKNLSLRRDILLFIRDYNSEYYQSLEERYQTLSNNSYSHYQALLNDYGLIYDDTSIDSIMHNSVDDVENMLVILEKMGMDSHEKFYVLKNSSLAIVLNIKEYIDRGILSIPFLRQNISLFDENSSKLSLFQSNIQLLNEFSINPLLFHSSLYVLLEDTSLLKHNLDLCCTYDLLKYLRDTKDYHFLEEKHLDKKIDRLIELGYEELLMGSLDCLNFNHMKRLEVLHSLSMPVESIEEMENVLEDDKSFFISEDSLDQYIPNVLDYVSKKDITISLEELQNMLISPRTYQIGSVFVSKEKVERLLGEGKDIYDAIFDGLKLTKEEYDEMISVLCNDSLNAYK